VARAGDRTRTLVALACLAGALGIVAARRLPRWVSDAREWGDGRSTWSDVRARGVRHAVWDAPHALAELARDGALGRLAPSPDGRWLVFAAGSDAAGWDLWVAELEGGLAVRARPLSGAESAADELAPAFDGGELWFASDRAGGAGGFDLWRAPFTEGRLGDPVPVAEINSAADELDPAPGRAADGEPVLLFASDRAAVGTLGLFEARLDDGSVRALGELDGPGDEREPWLSADGASVHFARVGREGGVLLRSFRDGAAWAAPHVPAGLEGVVGARAPALSADGFQLWFHADGTPLRADSRELAPQPLDDLGWKDLALVAALLLTALLAWLARRWHELDVLYKCLLASILAHLLLLWLLREVRPASEIAPPRPGEGPTFRVRVLEDSSRTARLEERAGELEVARAEAPLQAEPQRWSEEPQPDVASPQAAELAVRESALAEGPRAAQVALERATDAAPAEAPVLAAPSERFERLADAGPAAPRADAATLAPSAREPQASAAQPARADLAQAVESAAPARPGAAAALARPASEAAEGPAPELAQATRGADAEVAPAPGLAMPRETFEALDAPAPAARVPTATAFAPRASDAAEIARAEAALLLAPDAGSAREAVAPSALAAPRGAPLAGVVAARAPAEVNRSASAAAPAVALAAPAERFEPLGRAAATPASAPRRPEAASFAPARSAAKAPPRGVPQRAAALETPREALAEAPALELEIAPRSAAREEPVTPERLFDTPYRTRFGAQKATALREHGGSVETEEAVARGLSYLVAIQNADGSWGRVRARHEKYGQVAVGKTGLCFLAFLGAGHTPGVGQHGEVAERALRFLLSVQDAQTGHFGDGLSYSHGIATYALAECFALTGDARLRAPLESAVARILAAQVGRGPQDVRGGWGYFDADGPAHDPWPRASITAWQVMALESARLGGLTVPDAAFEAARGFLLGSWDGRLGAYRYSHDPGRLGSGYPTLPGSTPAALFALALLGEDLEGGEYDVARRYVLERAPRGYDWRGEEAFVARADANLYFWYYGTLACFRMGGTPWERWNAALKSTLLESQHPDGSWEAIDLYARDYAGDRPGDLSYTTALCVLSLEVYYRYFTPLLRVR
jgi:hypothetical protein